MLCLYLFDVCWVRIIVDDCQWNHSHIDCWFGLINQYNRAMIILPRFINLIGFPFDKGMIEKIRHKMKYYNV